MKEKFSILMSMMERTGLTGGGTPWDAVKVESLHINLADFEVLFVI